MDTAALMVARTVTLEHDTSTRRGRQAARAFSEGWAFQKKHKWRQALHCYDEALRFDPAMFPAIANRGMCWHHLSQPAKALADYDRAFKSGDAGLTQMIRVNRGVLLSSVRRYDEALADFASDNSPESRLNASYVHLLRGNFWQGLELYRARAMVRHWGAKLHRLADLKDKNVLIVHEQGFGDSIQMSRFVPDICAVARSVHWATKSPLMPLFTHNFPGVEFSDGNDVATSALIYKHDAFVLVMDLWQTAGLETRGDKYLRADPVRVEKMRRALPQGRKIGLSWRGRPEFSNDHNRSADLKNFLPGSLSATFVSLQKDLRDDERPFVFDGGALCADFADTAALMTHLDAVISVDTATAHLAGAIGIPTAVVLPYACDWRWGESGDMTPWYDSVRLFRQPAFGEWAPAIAQASDWVRCSSAALG